MSDLFAARLSSVTLSSSPSDDRLNCALSQRPLPRPPPLQVKALALHPEHARLHALIEVFASGGMSEFSAWIAKASGGEAGAEAELAALGLQRSRCLETMRLLSFCTLAASNRVLSYEAIGSALQVSACDFACRW